MIQKTNLLPLCWGKFKKKCVVHDPAPDDNFGYVDISVQRYYLYQFCRSRSSFPTLNRMVHEALTAQMVLLVDKRLRALNESYDGLCSCNKHSRGPCLDVHCFSTFFVWHILESWVSPFFVFVLHLVFIFVRHCVQYQCSVFVVDFSFFCRSELGSILACGFVNKCLVAVSYTHLTLPTKVNV